MKKIALERLTYVKRLVNTIAIVVSFALPFGYFLMSYKYLEGTVVKEAQIKAGVVSQLASKNPKFWRFGVERLLEVLERSELAEGNIDEEKERVIVLNKNGEQILVINAGIPKPVITYRTVFYDSGNLAGWIEVSQSARKTLYWTIFLAGISSVIGYLIYFFLTRYLMEALLKAYHDVHIEQEKAHITMRSIGDGVIATDKDGRIVLLNKVAEQLTGWTENEAVGMPFAEVFNIHNEKTREPCKNPVDEVLFTMDVIELANNTILIAKDGREIFIADSAAPILDEDEEVIGVVLVFRDDTEKRKVREEQLKTHKLESLGMLAGGIAHDFNNLLTGIVGNVSLAKLKLKDDHESITYLSSALIAGNRAQSLTQQLLTFSRGGAPILATASLKELIVETSSFIVSGTNVTTRFELRSLWAVEMDKGQISQVVNNLIINAQQAMPKGGLIQVRAKNVTLAERNIAHLPAGKYIRVKVKDSGIGIDENALEDIFTPYYSTKEKGHGLGLAISYSIVQKHKGHMTANSKLGRGTTVIFWLPASEKQVERVVKAEPVEDLSLLQKKKILIMDDEDYIQRLSKQMLIRLGCSVECVSSGEEAVEVFKHQNNQGQPFDAVLLDLTIPAGMGGKEAIQKMRDVDPEVKGVVFSGYSNDPIMSDFRKFGFSGVLPKPFEIEELGTVLATVLYQ